MAGFIDVDHLDELPPEMIQSLKRAKASKYDFYIARAKMHKLGNSVQTVLNEIELLKCNKDDLEKMKSKLKEFDDVTVLNGNNKPRTRPRKDFEQDLYNIAHWRGVPKKILAISTAVIALLTIINFLKELGIIHLTTK